MYFKHRIYFILAILIAVSITGCATKGFLTEKYQPDFYQIQKMLPESCIDENPTFIVYGDTQAEWRVDRKFIKPENWLTWKMLIFPFYEIYWIGNGASGTVNRALQNPDCGKKTRLLMRDAVYMEAKRSGADFILNTGDITAYDGRRPDHWALFLRENKHQHPLLNEIPYLPTVGNHDRVNNLTYGKANYEAVFDYPPFYKVEFKNLDLFVVDSNIIIDWKDELDDELQDRIFKKWYVSGDPQCPAWLERELANSEKTFKIVSMHHSPLSFGLHWKDWTNSSYGRDSERKRRELIDVMLKHGVQVVFSGHDHIYQHNYLHFDDKGGNPVVEMHFIVSSGGGVPLRNRMPDEKIKYLKEYYRNEGFAVELLMQEKVYHYCLVEVAPDEMIIKTIEVPLKSGEQISLMEKIIVKKPHTY